MSSRKVDVVTVLSQLAELVRSGAGVQDSAERVVALAKDNLDCDYAGITVRERGRLYSLAVSDAIVEKGDQLQYALRQGPCLDALWERDDFAVDNVATDPRWPQWGPQAAELGLTSLLAARIAAEHRPDSSLNLYASRPRHFTHNEIAFAHVFAHHAAAALRSAEQVGSLTRALDTRMLIGQAQGMLMERFDLTPDQAFAVLKRYSQDNNIKLNMIAEKLVETGTLPSVRMRAEAT